MMPSEDTLCEGCNKPVLQIQFSEIYVEINGKKERRFCHDSTDCINRAYQKHGVAPMNQATPFVSDWKIPQPAT